MRPTIEIKLKQVAHNMLYLLYIHGDCGRGRDRRLPMPFPIERISAVRRLQKFTTTTQMPKAKQLLFVRITLRFDDAGEQNE